MTLSPWGPTPFLTRYGWSADDDAFTAGNPGLTKAHEAAAILGADLAVPDFGDDRHPRATDFNDLHRHAGAVAVKACLDKACLDKDGRSADGRARDYRFKIVAFSEVTLDMSAAYIVEDLVPQTGLAVFWGPPKCGKSFFVFDLMMHVALGWKFRDLKVRQGPVVYCALEGGRGFQNRIEAFRRKKLEDHTGHVPFYLMASPMALVADQLALVASIRGQCPPPAVVVIDTLNRSITGSESSDEDMGNYIKAADAIRDAFNCVVIIVHHCGYEGTRPRGHSSLIGDLDAQVAVARDAERNIQVTVELMKDGKDGVEGVALSSRLETVSLGIDSEGGEITSCIVVPVIAAEGEAVKPLKAWEKGKEPKGAAKIAHEDDRR